MSSTYVASLVAVVLAIWAARVVVRPLPLRRVAVRIAPVEVAAVALGALGLLLHCGSMFFGDVVARVPGTDRAAADIMALGPMSMVWYVVPALLVLVGLRRQHPAAVVTAVILLTAVGITMFDGGPLDLHLAVVFATVAGLTAIGAAFVAVPWAADVATRRATRSRSD